MAGNLIGEEVLEHQHGKARVRVARKWIGPAGTQVIVEWSVSISLTSTALPAFTSGDNSAIVATDTMKNTVYVMAKKCTERLTIEEFGVVIGKHFVTTYPEVSAAKVTLIEKPWERVSLDGKPHEHGFKLGSEKRTADIYTTKDGSSKVKSGIQELILLKTTQSGFEGFIHDKYTLLADTNERMMASSVRAIWSYSKKPYSYEEAYMAVKGALMSKFYGPTRGGVYSPSVQNTLYTMAKEALAKVPEVESIYLNMPNIHFLPVNLPGIGVKFKDDVYLPTDEPHGTIEASLTRKGLLPVSKL
ncbi:unnamed protein product [Calypogeia fissa]